MFTLNTKLSIVKALITKKSPYYIQFFISNKCNLKCKMCGIVDSSRHIKEVDLSGIEKIAKNLKKIGVGIVLLTGGEPFLRKDIPEIVDLFTKNGFDVRLQTAGLITKKESLQQCINNKARDISVSLDSLNEEKQDYINGVPGSWKRTIETIAAISQIFPKKNSLCGIGCVLSSYNYKEIPDLLEFVTKIGWYLSLVPVHISSNKNQQYFFRGNDSSFMPNDIQLEELNGVLEKILLMKKNGYNLFDSDIYIRSIYPFLKQGSPIWRMKKGNMCDSPYLYFIVKPNGDFALCCDKDFPEKLSLIDDDFPEIYKSKEFREKADKITQECLGCQYGSYPEVTLSVRNMKIVWERAFLSYKLSKKSLIPHSAEQLFNLIEEIKKHS